MIVEVKGTRTGGAEDPAEKYVTKTDVSRSNMPFLIGLALGALGLYLRSMFGGAEPVATPTETRPEASPEAPADEQVAATLRPKPAATEPPAAGEEPAAAGSPEAGSGTSPFADPAATAPLPGGFASRHAVSLAGPDNVGGGRVAPILGGEAIPDGRAPKPFGGGGGGGGSGEASLPGGVPAPGGDAGDGPGGGPGSGDGGDGGDRPSPGDGDGSRDDGVPPDGSDDGGPGDGPDGGSDQGGPDDSGSDAGGSIDGSPEAPDGDDEDDHEAENRAPRVSGSVCLMDVTLCGLLAIALDDLLANAFDPDGDPLAVTNVSVSDGLLVADGPGWIFRPDAADLGPVTITYQISDGALSVDQTATFAVVRPAPLLGTDGDDLLVGGLCADEIDGRAGDDNIVARSGDDIVLGGDGDDHIVAGAGNDVVWAGAGADIVFGGSGDDHIFGGAGDDRLYGEDGDDVIHGGEGDDLVVGGAGNDILAGDAGQDELRDGPGSDVVFGGAGDDRVVAAADGAADVFDGGEGQDVVDFSAAAAPLLVDLALGYASGSDTGRDVVQGFESVIGGHGADILKGSHRDEVLAGSEGDDTLFGGAGDDTLLGGAGDDTIGDGRGSDVVDAGSGDDRVVAALDGVADSYDGGAGDDTLDYGAATAALVVDLGEGYATGIEIGADTIAGFERVIGGAGDDHFVSGPGPAAFAGGAGRNLFEFRGREGSEGLVAAIHEILDFKHGDRIRLSKYDLFEESGDAFENRFESIYLGGADEERPWIRYRHDDTEERSSLTRLEADFDRDATYETTILITGHHMLAFVENT